jgi:serine phosphatase RsbU (regulator of sigma subunit)
LKPQGEASSGPQLRAGDWEVWFFGRPHENEKVSGDLCFAGPAGESVLVVVADVLGHGEAAHSSAQAMLAALQPDPVPQIGWVVQRLEGAVQDRRGCTLFAGLLADGQLEYTLIGSIRAWLLGRQQKTMLLGQRGVVGLRPIQPQVRRVALETSATLVVCTDGIRQAFFPPADLLGLEADSVSLALRRIVAAYGIAEDDASVLIARRKITGDRGFL